MKQQITINPHDRITPRDVTAVLKDAQTKLPEAQKRIREFAQAVATKQRSLVSIDSEIITETAASQIAATQGDLKAVSRHARRVQELVASRAAIDRQVENMLNGPIDGIDPISDAANCVLAMAPAVGVLVDKFTSLPEDIVRACVESAPRVKWAG
jgi:hypothetical protein